MSIIYKPKKAVCNIPGKKQSGYIATKVLGSTISTNKLCKIISEKCTVTSADVKGVVEALVCEIELDLLQGYNIQLGELGTFSASLTSEVMDTPEELKPKKVRINKITFLPSVRLKDEMKKAEFMRLRDYNKLAFEKEEE